MKEKVKVINNYVDFLNEMDKGIKNICVSDEFYEWLKENIDYTYVSRNPKGPVATYGGVSVYREEKK